MSDSSEDGNGGPIVLCSNCKAHVVLTEPKRKLPSMQMLTSQHRRLQQNLQRNLVKASARKYSTGSTQGNKQIVLHRSDDALISTHRFTTRIIIPAILAVRAHQQIKKPSGHLNHVTNVGTATILPLACIPRYPNLRSVDVSI
ncbi:hypothetical protein ACFX1Q_040468 [Malus domestica]